MTALLIAAGVILAVITMFLVHSPVQQIWRPLIDPLASVRRHGAQKDDIPVTSGFLWLVASYFFISMLFAMTSGGGVGVLTGEPRKAQSGLLGGFLFGILMAGLARITAVKSTTSVADGMRAVVTLTFGVMTYVAVVNMPLFTMITDLHVRSLSDWPIEFPAFSVIVSFLVCSVVEVSVYLTETKGSPSGREVPLELVRRRIESHERAEQVFVPARVIPATNNAIISNIGKHGLRSFCWMTNTAPAEQMTELHCQTKIWIQKNVPTSRQKKTLERLMAANVRIIVPTEQRAAEVRKALPFVGQVRITNRTFRRRCMILNAETVIIHIPIPYHPGDLHEQSNYCAVSKSVELVSEVQYLFDAIWENLGFTATQEMVMQELASGDFC